MRRDALGWILFAVGLAACDQDPTPPDPAIAEVATPKTLDVAASGAAFSDAPIASAELGLEAANLRQEALPVAPMVQTQGPITMLNQYVKTGDDLVFAVSLPFVDVTFLRDPGAPSRAVLEHSAGAPWTARVDANAGPGAHILMATFQDGSLNSTVGSFIFYVDNDKPVVTVTDTTAAFDPLLPNGLLRVFDVHATDGYALDHMRILVDGQPTPYPSSLNPFSFNGVTDALVQKQFVLLRTAPDGNHVITAEVTDMAGNVGQASLLPYNRDRRPIVTCLVDASLDDQTDWTQVGLTATGVPANIEKLARVKFERDGQTVHSLAGPQSDSNDVYQVDDTVNAGPHDFWVTCIDQQSNQKVSPVVHLTAAPPPSCRLETSVTSDGQHVNMVATATSPNVTIANVQFLVDGVFAEMATSTLPVNVPFVASYQTNLLSGGSHTFQAVCVDSNFRPMSSTTYTIPIASPVMCGTQSHAGFSLPSIIPYLMGKDTGTAAITYQTFEIADRIKIYAGPSLVYDSGCVATYDKHTTAAIGWTGSSTLTVQVEPNCLGAQTTTEWNYTLWCQ